MRNFLKNTAVFLAYGILFPLEYPLAALDVGNNPAMPAGPASSIWWVPGAGRAGNMDVYPYEYQLSYGTYQASSSESGAQGAKVDFTENTSTYDISTSASLNENFIFNASIELFDHALNGSSSGSIPFKYEQRRRDLDIRAGPLLHGKGLTLGAWVGLRRFGNEAREIYAEGYYLKASLASVWLPYFNGVIALKAENTSFGLSIRFFNASDVEAVVDSDIYGKYTVDISRKLPAEATLMVKQDFTERLEISARYTYQMLKQGSNKTNELTYARNLEINTDSQLGSENKNADRYIVGFSAGYAARDDIVFTGSIGYRGSAVAKEYFQHGNNSDDREASQAGVGLLLGKDTRFLFDVLYVSETKNKYSAQAELEDSWASTGSTVEIKQSAWRLDAGYSYAF